MCVVLYGQYIKLVSSYAVHIICDAEYRNQLHCCHGAAVNICWCSCCSENTNRTKIKL